MSTDRVDVPVHEYLMNEAASMDHLDGYLAQGIVNEREALREFLQSYANVLRILSQQQLQRDLSNDGIQPLSSPEG